MKTNTHPNRRLVLGSALWGWSVTKSQVFDLLDHYVLRGGAWIDTAINYPINKQAEDFGKALTWLGDWLEVRGAEVLIILKVGATDNMGGPTSKLDYNHIMNEVTIWRSRLGDNLTQIAIHWDNRGNLPSDRIRIRESLLAFSKLKSMGYEIGFSGISFPRIYHEEALHLTENWWIQVKENAMTKDARVKLEPYFPDCKYLAYGINMGGVKMDVENSLSSTYLRNIKPSDQLLISLTDELVGEQLKPIPPSNLNELAIYKTFCNKALSGMIVGPRTIQQLDSTMDYWNSLLKYELLENKV